MPAECEVDNCGVIAVGRCGLCGKAMCTSHRAMLAVPGGFRTLVDLCSSCHEAGVQEEASKANEIEQRSVAAQARIKELVQRLAASGVAQTKYLHARTLKPGLFGDRWIEDPANHGYGWFVGVFEWNVIDGRPHSDGGTAEEMRRTFVTGDGRIASQGGGGNNFRHGPSALVGAWTANPTTKSEFWERVASALEALAARSGA